jgi:opacity protein-like surface antigen
MMRREAKLTVRPLILFCALLPLVSAARAEDARPAHLPAPSLAAPSSSASSLPSLALDPQAPPPSIWKGLYVGADIFLSGGGKRSKGLVGGGAYIGYDRRFDNNLVLGIQATTGFAPFSFQRSPFKGYDYVETSAKLGYEMGRVTPYMTVGIALAKPNGAPGAGYLSPTDSANAVFNGGSNLGASGVIGAGVDYALTNNTKIGVAAVVGTGRGFIAPP